MRPLPRRLLTAAVLIAALGGGTAWWIGRHPPAGKGPTDRVARVKRKDLTLRIVEIGTLSAMKNNKLMVEVRNWQVKLVKLIPEGSVVKTGDMVAELDRAETEMALSNLRVEVDIAEKAIRVAEQELRVQHIANTSALQGADTAMAQAARDLERYLKFEGPKQAKEKTVAVDNQRTVVETARKKRSDLVEQQEKNLFLKEDAEEQARKDLEAVDRELRTAQVSLEAILLDQKIFKLYTLPDEQTKRQAALEKAALGLAQARVTAGSNLVAKETQLTQREAEFAQKKKNMEMTEKELVACTLKAPVDGIVTYGDPDQPYYREHIQVGRDIQQGMVVATIPDTSGYEVSLKIGEEYRSLLERDQKAVATFAAVEGERLDGQVEEIGNLALPSINWDPGSPKVYTVKVRLGSGSGKLVPGMTAKVEIVTGQLAGALTVPIESVRYEDGKPHCLLEGNPPQRRELVLGPGTETEVSVKEGLSEGDPVLLSEPSREGASGS